MKKFFSIFLLLSSILTCTAQENKQTFIKMHTSMGDIVIKLYNETPKHSNNFKKLVEEGVYDSLLFHRVICDFMVQGGDPESKNAKKGAILGEGDLGYSIDAEFNTPKIYHKRGSIAMAREGDVVNPERKSSSCQFYIVTGRVFSDPMLDKVQERLDMATDGKVVLTEEMRNTYRTIGGTPHLDGQYTVFGEVVEGMEVVDKIQRVKTDYNDRPEDDVIIIRATVIENHHQTH